MNLFDSTVLVLDEHYAHAASRARSTRVPLQNDLRRVRLSFGTNLLASHGRAVALGGQADYRSQTSDSTKR
jgi:hypothetical protein